MLMMFSALQGCSMWFDMPCVMLKPFYLLQYLYIFQSSGLFFMYSVDLIMGLFKREGEREKRKQEISPSSSSLSLLF